MLSWWLQVVGLLAGFVGAYFLAVSQQPTQGRSLVLANPQLWQWGLYVLCAAFVIQLAALILGSYGL
jgi:drug/metabolite transporter (DMT)-like permease